MTNERSQKNFEDPAADTYKDNRLVGHIPIDLFCRYIETRNNQVSAEVKGTEENWKMAYLYHVFIM